MGVVPETSTKNSPSKEKTTKISTLNYSRMITQINHLSPQILLHTFVVIYFFLCFYFISHSDSQLRWK